MALKPGALLFNAGCNEQALMGETLLTWASAAGGRGAWPPLDFHT